MQIHPDFSTTFESDDEARRYGRAANAYMTTPALDVPLEHWQLVRGWTAQAMRMGGKETDPVQEALWAATVAPGRILGAVLDHFKILG